MPSSMQKRTA